MNNPRFTRSQTLRVGLDWEVDLIDPPASFGGWNTGRVAQQIFESLVEDDLHEESASITSLIPALCEHVDVSQDGCAYTFALRQNVIFHDGTPFDATAAKFNYDRMWNPEAPHFSETAADYNRVGLESVSKILATASHQLVIQLREPFPEFLRYMTQGDAPGAQVFISPQALATYGNDRIPDHAPGTGPYRFEARFDTPGGSGVDLVANHDYWAGRPNLPAIKFLPFPDAAERLNALVGGQIDIAYSLDSADLGELRRLGFNVRAGPAPYIWYFVFNMRDPWLADRRVRQAIAHAFNRERLSEREFRGNTRPAYGVLPPASPSYDPTFPNPYPYNPELARKLISEAGLPDGWKLRAVVARAGSAQLDPTAICGALQRDLGFIGMRLEVTYRTDWVDYCNEWRSGMPPDTGLSEMSWGMSCDVWLEQVLHSKNVSPYGFNAGHFADPSADRLLDLARRTAGEAERIGLYRTANKIIMEELPILPVLTVYDGSVASHRRVRGLRHPRQNWHAFERVSLDPDI